MAKLIKIGKVWYSDLRVRCDGTDCPTPAKGSVHHTHRRRQALSIYRDVAENKLADLVKARNAQKHHHPVVNPGWELFKKLKFFPYSRSKDPQTHYRDTLAIKYLELYCRPAQLRDVTPAMLDDLKVKLKAAGKKDWNINRVLSALKAMMRKAEEWKLIEPQNWRGVKSFRTPKGRLRFWSEAEIEKLLETCAGQWGTVAYLVIFAGLRRGEIRALRWECVDFDRNRIHIVANEEWVPKDFERRFIPMKPRLREHLARVKRQNLYVVGDRRTLGTLTNYFRRLVKEAKLSGSLITGRHSYGSHLAMAGVPLAVIKERMGHSSVRTTEIYAHLCPETMSDKYAA